MYQSLFSDLSSTDLILTPNRRLAAYLKRQYAYQQNQCHQSPDILPLTSWLERCWQELQIAGFESKILLTSAQEQYLWGQLIQNSPAGEHLLRITGTAKMAQQAWQLVQQWQLDFTTSIFQQSEDHKAWQAWAKNFQRECQNNNWLDNSTLIAWLIKQFESGEILLPKRIFLIGFDEINPQHQQLFKLLSTKGVTVNNTHYYIPNAVAQRLACIDAQDELQTMARWAHQCWQQGIGPIGCVIPNLADIREEVITTFTEIFAPVAQLPGYHETVLPFNISAGKKLKDFPIIHTALLLLGLNQQVKLSQLGTLLRSPYLGYAEQEMAPRARLDAQLRSFGETSINLQHVLVTAQKMGINKLASLLQIYLRLISTIKNQKMSPLEWADHFVKRLKTLGWPGERSLDSTEHQLIESWSNLLTAFTQLSLVAPALTYQEALQQLHQIASTQEFQSQSPIVPVQILGLLEGAGLEFQQLWVMGLHDHAWPVAPSPNPFIPIRLQYEKQLPHASSSRELKYCQALTTRFCQSAAQVILSYPQTIDDRALQPSPLINALPALGLDNLDLPPHQTYAQQIYHSAQLETFTDDFALPLSATENIRGGSTLFKDQAACPFRAFARFRLGAQALESPQGGLKASERGTLLHRALEIIWNVLGSQQQLITCSEADLDAILDQSIETALLNFSKKKPFTVRARFIQIEKIRLTHLLKSWLEIEKNRPPFIVQAVEEKDNIIFANIPLSLRMDRIDQLTDGSRVVIDYKTGHPSIKDWLGERPNDPQLPLYCVTSELPIAGILFAQVRSDAKKYQGLVADDKFAIPGTQIPYIVNETEHLTNWDELVLHWQAVLKNLGEQITTGYAKVDPKEGQKTCQFCDLQTLCRVTHL